MSYLRTPYDIDSDEYIIENLKMEIHMILFHSAESLFLTVLGHYFYSAAPWLWMSSCDLYTTRDIVNVWKAKGLEAIIKEPEKPEEWLRETLYPNVIESGKHYQKAKDSADFIKKFLDKMVAYYMDHNEYNAYKHGLRLFPGWGGLTAIDESTKNLKFSSHGDEFRFLKYTRLKGTRNREDLYGYSIKHCSKRYDVRLDIDRIEVITGILQNFLEEKHVQFRTLARQKSRNFRVYFDDKKVNDFFGSGLSEICV